MRLLKRRFGFTMIELLIVMGIIMLLAAIMFPAVTGARKSALKSKAQSDIKMLHTAIQSFRNEYNRYPLHSSDSDITYDNEALTATLMANNTADNPRNIPFIKVTGPSLEDGQFVDPWKDSDGTNAAYHAAVDADFDGEIDVNIDKGNVQIDTVTNVPIAVWTLGNPDDDKVGPFTTWGGEYVERNK